MPPTMTDYFDLPARLHGKADAALIADDLRRFAEIGGCLDQERARLEERLERLRRVPGGSGEAALERDLEIHRLSARLRLLGRYGVDLCLGRMVGVDGEPVYLGRIGLVDDDGRRLLVDWRAPAAEPFFAATHAEPMGLASRRRYRWSRGRIVDYWDEVFQPGALAGHAALDDQSAFIASLGASRSSRMRDVLATIQADQDAIIRASARGALVVDGGPGTGKTVVALHRAAYLRYAEPRIARGGQGVLVVGPHPAYLAYVDDVLPSLGEDSVQTCTMPDLVPEGATAGAESDPAVARLKASTALVEAVERAVRRFERPPATALAVETDWADVVVEPGDWADAFDAAEPGATHNDAREQVRDALLDLLVDRVDEDTAPRAVLRRAFAQHEGFARALDRAWPLLDPVGLVADLWSVPALLEACAPTLTAAERAVLHRDDPRAWTVADLPLLDAARHLVGDPEAGRRRAQREAARAAERRRRAAVIDDLVAADDSALGIMSILRGQDALNSLDDDAVLPTADPDLLAGPFAHLVVDEAQELTDAEWRMLLRRCPSRSLTIVGDRAQARHGFAESWRERLARVGLRDIRIASLTVNYRTPEEVMAEAEPVIRAALPDANVPVSVRRSGLPVERGAVADLDRVVDGWLAEHEEGVAVVIGAPGFAERARVRSLSPVTAKGLEFDLVVLVEPERFGDGIEGAVDRYVAMTRSTGRLVMLSG